MPTSSVAVQCRISTAHCPQVERQCIARVALPTTPQAVRHCTTRNYPTCTHQESSSKVQRQPHIPSTVQTTPRFTKHHADTTKNYLVPGYHVGATAGHIAVQRHSYRSRNNWRPTTLAKWLNTPVQLCKMGWCTVTLLSLLTVKNQHFCPHCRKVRGGCKNNPATPSYCAHQQLMHPLQPNSHQTWWWSSFMK